MTRPSTLMVAALAAAICTDGAAQAEPSAMPRTQAAIAPAGANRPPTPQVAPKRSDALVSAIMLADVGFAAGLRFANLGGRRELFVPLPQGEDVAASELILVLDDISAHDARRSLEVLVNDRSVAAIPLDGRSRERVVRVALNDIRSKQGYLKLTLLYSGAATQDRCIDVRYVGDSVTIRPESAIEIGFEKAPDVATTVALMPRLVTIALPPRPLSATEIATALTVARSLAATGRRAQFHRGYTGFSALIDAGPQRRWTRGLIIVGRLEEAAAVIEAPIAAITAAGASGATLTAVRVGGAPALVVSDAAEMRAGRLFADTAVKAMRGVRLASLGDAGLPAPPDERLTFEELDITSAQAEVFGRAELAATIDIRRLPAGRQPSRIQLDVMVAPDGAGEKAVVSAYVNERLLASTVAASGEPTRFDLALPEGLVGSAANIRAVVQRRSAQGDCRFEPQGYPAQILGSSTVVLSQAAAQAGEFADLTPHWAERLQLMLPASAADAPEPTLSLVAQVLDALVPETARLDVTLVPRGTAPAPTSPFIAIGETPPKDAAPRARFDRGRVVVADRGGRTLLDLAGFGGGAVAQLVVAGATEGIWIRPIDPAAGLPTPAAFRLERGDVAFIDSTGVALAMSTTRDTLVRIAYPDQVSWLSVAERFRPWVLGSLWLVGTVAFLFALQRLLRRRSAAPSE